MNRRNRAFTLIEIIIVISIILVLMGMVLLGVRKVNESSRSNATKVMMENGRSMLSEYSRVAAPNTALSLIVPTQPLNEAMLPVALWEDDTADTNPVDALGRYGAATIYTRGMVVRMMQVPAVRQMVQSFSAERLLRYKNAMIDPLQGVVGYVPPAAPAGTNIFNVYTFNCFTLADGGVNYAYMCGTSHEDAVTTRPRSGTGSVVIPLWLELGPYDGAQPNGGRANTTPVPLDGFGNPMFLMPVCGFLARNASGCRLITSAGTFPIRPALDIAPTNDHDYPGYWVPGRRYEQGDYVAFAPRLLGTSNDLWQIYKNVSTRPATATGTNAPTISTATWSRVATQPFWASAGADGFFSPGPGPDNIRGTADDTHPDALDDNVYSFEN